MNYMHSRTPESWTKNWLRRRGKREIPMEIENPQQRPKWYQGIVPVFVALIMLGPFGLPLLWKSPCFNLFWKISLTLLMVAATVWMMKAGAEISQNVMKQFEELKQSGLY